MSASDPWSVGFARFLDAAAPYLDEIVVAGGWASRLYRLDPHANPPTFDPLMTKDVDAATPNRMEIRTEPLDKRLRDVGFEESLFGRFPPADHALHVPRARWVRG